MRSRVSRCMLTRRRLWRFGGTTGRNKNGGNDTGTAAVVAIAVVGGKRENVGRRIVGRRTDLRQHIGVCAPNAVAAGLGCAPISPHRRARPAIVVPVARFAGVPCVACARANTQTLAAAAVPLLSIGLAGGRRVGGGCISACASVHQDAATRARMP